MTILLTAVMSLVAYCLGSIPSGLLLAKAFTGRDVRELGSGNIGAANVSRAAGIRVAGLVLIADVGKGAVAVLIGRATGLDAIGLSIVAGCAVLGHDFSVFLGGRGGKGIATTLGVLLVLAPVATAAAAVVWLIVFAVTRLSSLSSLLALWSLPILLAAFDQSSAYIALTAGLGLLAIWTHRDNLERLSRGEERQFGRTALG